MDAAAEAGADDAADPDAAPEPDAAGAAPAPVVAVGSQICEQV